jgi:bifunctional non-homologous end joining protein LigD
VRSPAHAPLYSPGSPTVAADLALRRPLVAREVKLDGWRVQAHRDGPRVALLTRNGHDCTRRFHAIAAAVAKLPATAIVLDGEVVALDEAGLPDFTALHRGTAAPLRFYAFDLLHLDGRDFGGDPLANRKALLDAHIAAHGSDLVKAVPAFTDGAALLAKAEEMHLEGVVSKRTDAPYRSGTRSGWAKIKTRAWREANRERWRLFVR